MRSIGIDNLRIHDLRHDFCSKLVQKGVPLNVVMELAGHSDISQTLRYAHLQPKQKSEAIKVFNRKAPAQIRTTG
jgi:site-specific recombinase XerD